MTPRASGRRADELRPLRITRHYTKHAEGSVLIEAGDTKVLCTASVEDGVPPFLKGKGQGWLTSEYSMLPSSTLTRKARDRSGNVDGRSVEIQRLIGRALRAVVKLGNMTERTVWVDCDVLQADGGTRTTAISGAWVALHDLFTHMDEKRVLRSWPLASQVAAVSVGVVEGEERLDLAYLEDRDAHVDANVVMLDPARFVEVQGTGGHDSFTRGQLDILLDLAESGIAQLFAAQRRVLGW